MSTSDALSTSTKRLSLSTDLNPDFLSPFTLISADDHRFSVDALKLAAASNVFRDMLSSSGGERESKLTESKEEIEDFLKVIEKGGGPVDEEVWYSVFKMSDKYEAQVALYRLLLVRLKPDRSTHFQLRWRDSLKSQFLTSATSLETLGYHTPCSASVNSGKYAHVVTSSAAARVPPSTTADGALYASPRECVHKWPMCTRCFAEVHSVVEKLQNEWVEKEKKIPFFE